MTVRSELFVSDHAGAIARAEARDAGSDPQPGLPFLDLTGVTAYDLEALGAIAARAVQYGTGALELEEVDLEHESLFELTPFLCEVLVELGKTEDPELPGEIAAQWASDEDLELAPDAALPLLMSMVSLAAAARDVARNVYLWVGSAATA